MRLTRSNARDVKRLLRPRPRAAQKGDFGRVFIIGGSRGLTGAAHLAALAALRTGAGLVTLGCPESVYGVLARRESEIMVRPFAATRSGSLAWRARAPILQFLATQDVFALGPGLSRTPETGRLIRALVASARVPTVLDADGLNAFEDHRLPARRSLVLTPHPGEFKRLFRRSCPADDRGRARLACETARKHRIVMVLKGYHTVIASPEGRVRMNPTGNPGLAKGGSGDVLTGVIAALLGQGLSPFDAAWVGVYVHGLAADLAVRRSSERSLAATEVIAALPAVWRRLTGK